MHKRERKEEKEGQPKEGKGLGLVQIMLEAMEARHLCYSSDRQWTSD